MAIEAAIDVSSKRITVKGLGEFHYKWGKLWAFAKNRPISRLITDVFEARVEANHEQIQEMLEDIAQQRGITVEELIEEVLKADD